MLKSKKDGDWYIGSTNNLIQRIDRHNKGYVPATKDRRPFELVYYEACLSKKLAIAREKSLKTGYGRAYLSRRLTI